MRKETNNFSIVLPVHNERYYLPYSLPSIFRLKPDEVILVFDRCTDGSIDIAKKIARHFQYRDKTKLLVFPESIEKWAFRIALVRRYGFMQAQNDLILNTDADTILDIKIKQYLPLIKKKITAFISFQREAYPPTLQSMIAKLISLISPKKGFSGIYAFSKEAWEEMEDKHSIKTLKKAEDTHLHLSISRKYKTLFIKSKTLHLREKETFDKQYSRGIVYWVIKRNPLWKAILHSTIYLRPYMLVGYLHTRLQKNIKHAQ